MGFSMESYYCLLQSLITSTGPKAVFLELAARFERVAHGMHALSLNIRDMA